MFTFHRTKVMQIVQNAAIMARTSTTTVSKEKEQKQDHQRHRPQHAIFFGPGNCNDLNLSQLLDDDDVVFDTITLVDIDNVTTKQGVDRQLLASTSRSHDKHDDMKRRIFISPSIDLSNTIAHTADWAEHYNKSPPRHLYNAALKAVQTRTIPIIMDSSWLYNSDSIGTTPAALDQQPGYGGYYDVAVSLCILSQFASSLSLVLDSVTRIMDLVVLIVAVRNRHFSQLIQSLRPGGYGIMIIDMVSMDTLPELSLIQEDDVDAAMMERLIEHAEQTGSFFRGTKRVAVVQALKGEFGHLVDNVQLGPPWKWSLAANKHYIVNCVVFRRKKTMRSLK